MIRLLIIFACAFTITGVILLIANPFANAGQTNDFCYYAKQGIVRQLHNVYGNGIPYKVSCAERDTFNPVTGVHDTLIIHIDQ